MTAASPPGRDAPWTSRRLLAWTSDYLERKAVDSPRLAAEMLLAHVLEVPRIKLYMDMDRPASPLERSAYRSLVERAAAHEPVQYLVGQTSFFSLDFAVTPEVLIPRPSTETLVEHIIQRVKRTPGLAAPVIADVGTGSGCIAIALAKNLPAAGIIATDLSSKALAVAKQNAAAHGVADRITFREGDLLEPLAGTRFAFIASNPPYISDAEWEDVAPNVKEYEPIMALRAGADGLDVLRRLIAGAGELLEEDGQLVAEIAASQKSAVLALVEDAGNLHNARVLADAESHPRVLVADRSD
jgi:release factor glutamine methyltransferase